jgi:telomerase protein component 1
MKLSRPETWERELSLRGNRASVWEELIGRVTIMYSSSLPDSCLYLLDPDLKTSLV